MVSSFALAQVVKQYSSVPFERIHIVSRFEELPLREIRRGVVYLLAEWSGLSLAHFRAITVALSRMDYRDLEFFVVDIDCVPESFLAVTFQSKCPAGAGETLWIRDGVVVASTLTYPCDDVEAVFVRLTKQVVNDSVV